MGKLNADFFQGGGFCVPRQVSQIYVYQTNIEKKLTWLGFKLKIKGSLVLTVSNGARTLLIFALRIQLHSW